VTTDLNKVIEWFCSDDTGMSSEAIAAHMWGANSRLKCRDMWCAPSDPSDLGRCLRLLKLFPEWKPRIHEMKSYGKEWTFFVDHFAELEKSMTDEVGIFWEKGRSAPKTYELMQKLQKATP